MVCHTASQVDFPKSTPQGPASPAPGRAILRAWARRSSQVQSVSGTGIPAPAKRPLLTSIMAPPAPRPPVGRPNSLPPISRKLRVAGGRLSHCRRSRSNWRLTSRKAPWRAMGWKKALLTMLTSGRVPPEACTCSFWW